MRVYNTTINDNAWNELSLDYECPYCEAKPGEPCRTARGFITWTAHAQRLKPVLVDRELTEDTFDVELDLTAEKVTASNKGYYADLYVGDDQPADEGTTVTVERVDTHDLETFEDQIEEVKRARGSIRAVHQAWRQILSEEDVEE